MCDVHAGPSWWPRDGRGRKSLVLIDGVVPRRCRGPFAPRLSGRRSLTCPVQQHSSRRNDGRLEVSCRWSGLDGHAVPGSCGPRGRPLLGWHTALTTKGAHKAYQGQRILKRPLLPLAGSQNPSDDLHSAGAVWSSIGTRTAPRWSRATLHPGPARESSSAPIKHARHSRPPASTISRIVRG